MKPNWSPACRARRGWIKKRTGFQRRPILPVRCPRRSLVEEQGSFEGVRSFGRRGERCERFLYGLWCCFGNGSVAIISHATTGLLLVAGAFPVVLYHWSTLCTLAGIVQHFSEKQPGSKLRCFKRAN
eukprot:s964_g20.t1